MSKRLHIAALYSRLRVEEKWIFGALEARGIDLVRLDDRQVSFDIANPAPWQTYDAVLIRSISTSRGLNAARLLNAWGVPTINRAAVAEICSDKVATSVTLAAAGLPQLRTRVAFSVEAALDAIEELGYPVVLKPPVGSWGRLLAKINDRDAAEAILEHKSTLGSVSHSIFYMQEYIETRGRDLRVVVIDGQAVAAIERQSPHWITNTARGAAGAAVQITPEIAAICAQASDAVGGGLLSVDLFEHPQHGYVVNEVNHTTEFHTAQPVSGVDIASLIVDYVVKVAQGAADA